MVHKHQKYLIAASCICHLCVFCVSVFGVSSEMPTCMWVLSVNSMVKSDAKLSSNKFHSSSLLSYIFSCFSAVLPLVVLRGDRVASERLMVSFEVYLQRVAAVRGANCFVFCESCNVFVL